MTIRSPLSRPVSPGQYRDRARSVSRSARSRQRPHRSANGPSASTRPIGYKPRMAVDRGQAARAGADPPAIALPRSSGVLLHITSLPGGRLGAPAYEMVDWLAAAGPDVVADAAARAAGPGPLAVQGELRVRGLAGPARRASRPRVAGGDQRLPRAQRVLDRGLGALRGHGAIADQVRFEREWTALRSYAQERGVRLMGDIAIYVAPDSVDHRAHPETVPGRACRRRAAGPVLRRRASCGATPCMTGRRCASEGYRWWVERLRRSLGMFDLVRIDHFRGFVAYWAVPEGDRTRWAAAGAGAPDTRCSTPSGASCRWHSRCRSSRRISA